MRCEYLCAYFFHFFSCFYFGTHLELTSKKAG
nr:MAG TPA: hypothetical protein [Caudoviricetes sp.]